jgi:hypothetical protein
MSEPKRYEPSSHYSADFGMAQSPVGKWVSYKDYARLKAEVERLTKAGDELHAFLINYIVDGRISSAYLNKLDDGWNAAKEGKQS